MAVDPLQLTKSAYAQKGTEADIYGGNSQLKLLAALGQHVNREEFQKQARRLDELNNRKRALLQTRDAKGIEQLIKDYEAYDAGVTKLISADKAVGNLATANDIFDGVAAAATAMHGEAPTLGDMAAMIGRETLSKTPLGALVVMADSLKQGDINIPLAGDLAENLLNFTIDRPATMLNEIPPIRKLNEVVQAGTGLVRDITPDIVRDFATGIANVPDELTGGIGEALKAFGQAATGRLPSDYEDPYMREIMEERLREYGGDPVAAFGSEFDQPVSGVVEMPTMLGGPMQVERDYPAVPWRDAYQEAIDPLSPWGTEGRSLQEQINREIMAEENLRSMVQSEAASAARDPLTGQPLPLPGAVKLYRDGNKIYNETTGEVVSPERLTELLEASKVEGRPAYILQDYDREREFAEGVGLTLNPRTTITDEDILPTAPPPALGGTPSYTQGEVVLDELPPLPGSAGQPGIDPLREAALQPGDSVEAARASGYELPQAPSPVVPQTTIREPVQTRPIDPLMPQVTPFTQAPALPAATPAAYSAPALSQQNYVAFTEDIAPLSSPYGDTRGRARGVGEQQLERSIISDILKGGKQQPRKQTQMPALSPAMKTRIF